MSQLFNGDQLRVKPDPDREALDPGPNPGSDARNPVHDILEEEAALRMAKVQTLRQARFARDAAEAHLAEPKPARKVRVPPRFAK